MSGELITVWGASWKTLESAGIAISSGAIAKASIASYDVVADGAYYPDAEFVLTGTFATAPTENTTLALYARPLLVDGTNNAEEPETTRPTVAIGTFSVNNVTTMQTLVLNNGIAAQDVPQKADYYIHNNGTGQTFGAGWTLKVRARTVKTAA